MTINPLQHVQPGDLITAAWANDVVDEINAILVQLAAVGSPPDSPPTTSGPPVLTGRSPTGDVHVGDELTLFGENFSPRHNGLTRVNFGGIQLTETSFLIGSSDTQLSFAVPGIPPGTVGVTVSTPQGTSPQMLSVNVLAATQPNSGSVHADPHNDPANPPTPQAGQPLQLQWIVSSDTIFPDTYTFSIDVANIQPTGKSWPATLNATEMSITPGAPFTVVATLSVPDTGSADVMLTATSATDSARHTSSNPIHLEVGTATPTSDPRIALRVANPQPQFDAGGHPTNAFLTMDGDQAVINVNASSDSFVQIQVSFSDTTSTPPLNYRFFASVDDTTHWAVHAASPATLVQTLPNGTTTVNYAFTNLATDSAQNQATLTVSAAKLKLDATDDYVSFAPVTLRNAGPS
jgi:hypothetical protein